MEKEIQPDNCCAFIGIVFITLDHIPDNIGGILSTNPKSGFIFPSTGYSLDAPLLGTVLGDTTAGTLLRIIQSR